MAEQLEVAELVKVSVEDERIGVTFYSRLAAKGGRLEAIFTRLAAEEKIHQARFEAMLKELGGVTSPEQYPGEYMAYLEALTTGRAFPDQQTALKLADQCPSDQEALNLAGRFERDTLILMNELGQLLPEKDRAIVKELADEERGHLVTLAEARRKLVGN